MKKITKKLTLHKEVIRALADTELMLAHGGMINQTITDCVGPECATVHYTQTCGSGQSDRLVFGC